MIELLTQDTILEAEELIHEFHLNSIYKDRFYDRTKVLGMLTDVLKDTETSVCLLYREGDEIVGILVGTVVQFIFSHEELTTELCFYVKPHARKSRIGLQLMKQYEYWSKEVVKTDCCSLINLNDERVDRLYQAKGYTPHERTYLKWQR